MARKLLVRQYLEYGKCSSLVVFGPGEGVQEDVDDGPHSLGCGYFAGQVFV